MRLHLLHVWVACTREGNLARFSTFQVRIMPTPSLPPLLTFVFSLLAADNHAYFRTFVIASIAGIYSLFPLLFTPAGEPYSYSRFIPIHECHRDPNFINIFSPLGSVGSSAIKQTGI